MLCRPRLAARFCHVLLTFCCGRTLFAHAGTTNATGIARFLTNHSQLQAYWFEAISTSLAPNRSGFTLILSLMPIIPMAPIFTVKAFGLQPSFCASRVRVRSAFYELQDLWYSNTQSAHLFSLSQNVTYGHVKLWEVHILNKSGLSSAFWYNLCMYVCTVYTALTVCLSASLLFVSTPVRSLSVRVCVLCAPQSLTCAVSCPPGAHVQKQRRCASLSCTFFCKSLRPCSTTL